MAVKYIGGNGHLQGIPRRDMTDAELRAMPFDLAAVVKASPFYRECLDSEVEVERADWVISSDPGGHPARVLLACPTLRLEPETIDAVFAQDWRGPLDFYFTRDNPFPADLQRGYPNINHNLNKARAHCLAGNYDALFIVESDIIPPANALSRLASLDGDVCGGLYVMRHGTPVPNAFTRVAGQTDPGSYILPWEVKDAWGKVIRTNGVCTGCVLIRRRVLEVIRFRPHDSAAPDWTFMTDCNEHGFTTLCDLSVVCGHKRPDGTILWPTKDGWREDKPQHGLRNAG